VIFGFVVLCLFLFLFLCALLWQVGKSQSVFVRFRGAYELRILVPRKRLRTFWKSDVLERKETEREEAAEQDQEQEERC
jgi:hypothetical protein